VSSYKLNTELGSHNNITSNKRKCTLCNLYDIEDEFHFLLKCPIYTAFRRQYIPKYFYTNTNMFKYITRMQSEKYRFLKILHCFVINLLNYETLYCNCTCSRLKNLYNWKKYYVICHIKMSLSFYSLFTCHI